MNHDYAHCLDYYQNKAQCPKGCFRAQLVEDLKNISLQYTTWAHFAGTDECPLKSFTVKAVESHDA